MELDDASTPLTFEESQGLIPSYITLRRELNEAEQRGILAADAWAFARRRNVLDEKFLLMLHKRMFGGVWRWAGKFRTTARNIGVDHWLIGTSLRQLLDDARFWIAQGTYEADEIGARFHHRLVWIHPFVNGNGRHARLAADLLAVSMGKARFSWGRGNLQAAGSEVRREYVEALRAADRCDVRGLVGFLRS